MGSNGLTWPPPVVTARKHCIRILQDARHAEPCESLENHREHRVPREAMEEAVRIDLEQWGYCTFNGIYGGLMGSNGSLPSGKHTKNYGKSPCSMGKSTISMVIFNSYVKLPEVMQSGAQMFVIYDHLICNNGDIVQYSVVPCQTVPCQTIFNHKNGDMFH